MKNLLLSFLYYPLRKIATKLPPSRALKLAGCLGDLEYQAYQKKNKPFTSFLRQMFFNSPLEGRVEEIKRKCIRYRHKAFISRTFSNPKQVIPVKNANYISQLGGRGICFPVFHFGFFYMGFVALRHILPVSLYTISMMKNTDDPLEARIIEIKKSMLRELQIKPIFDINQFKTQCLPAVSNSEGCYVPTFDAVTKTSKIYPFLSGNIVLSISATANFVFKHGLPIVPFFTLGKDMSSLKIAIEPPFDPKTTPQNIASVESWYLSLLEKYALAYPELVDWFFVWKNLERFQKKKNNNPDQD